MKRTSLRQCRLLAGHGATKAAPGRYAGTEDLKLESAGPGVCCGTYCTVPWIFRPLKVNRDVGLWNALGSEEVRSLAYQMNRGTYIQPMRIYFGLKAPLEWQQNKIVPATKIPNIPPIYICVVASVAYRGTGMTSKQAMREPATSARRILLSRTSSGNVSRICSVVKLPEIQVSCSTQQTRESGMIPFNLVQNKISTNLCNLKKSIENVAKAHWRRSLSKFRWRMSC